jgi:hypothetical protein
VVWDVFWAREAIAASYGPEEANRASFAETHHAAADEVSTVRVVGRVESIRAIAQRMQRLEPSSSWTNIQGDSIGWSVEQVPGLHPIDSLQARASSLGSSELASTVEPDWAAIKSAFSTRGDGVTLGVGSRDRFADPSVERNTDVGWIVQLEVDDEAALPKG